MRIRQNVNSSKVPLQFRSITAKSQLNQYSTLYRNCGTAGTGEITKLRGVIKMCKRKTKLMTIYFENTKGIFKSQDEILKFTDALKAKLEYIRKRNKDYYINAFIGASQLNIRYGDYAYTDNGKPGRNSLIRVPKPYLNASKKFNEPWHVHLLLEANPGETIGQELVNYFNKKFKREIARKKKVDAGFFAYVMKQSGFIRYVVEDRPTDLVKYNFKTMYEANYKPPTKTDKKFRKLNKNSLRRVRITGGKNKVAGLHTIN